VAEDVGAPDDEDYIVPQQKVGDLCPSESWRPRLAVNTEFTQHGMGTERTSRGSRPRLRT
jgi:hypothetical protein